MLTGNAAVQDTAVVAVDSKEDIAAEDTAVAVDTCEVEKPVADVEEDTADTCEVDNIAAEV